MLKYGFPNELLVDNGKRFTGKYFPDVCHILNIHNPFITINHPQTRGQVERLNCTLIAAIQNSLDNHSTNWDLYTPYLPYAYNCLPHTSTASEPFKLVLSSPPPPLALRIYSNEYSTPKEAKNKWRR